MEQEQYEEDIKVVILPDRQEVTSEDLTTMPDVVKERVRYFVCFLESEIILLRFCLIYRIDNIILYKLDFTLTHTNFTTICNQVVHRVSS